MTEKNTYWIADPYGSKALVQGVDEINAWIPRGWGPSGEPSGTDRVWMRHEVHGGRAQFPADAVEQWQALGWAPSDPEPPYDVTKDPQLVDVQTSVERDADATDTESAEKTTTKSAGRQRRAGSEES